MTLQIFTRVRQLDRRLVLFDDVLPVLEELKARSIVLGLISNLSRRLDGYCNELGLIKYIDFTLASFEVDAEKSHPSIFLAALERAGVSSADAIHVGDQYYADVIGARTAGIKPLLLDRNGFWEDVSDCSRIRSLWEIAGYL